MEAMKDGHGRICRGQKGIEVDGVCARGYQQSDKKILQQLGGDFQIRVLF